ncbi:MAG: T9SS type A sorting domain-containing protein, partial [Bacteroidota bacterium]
EYCYGVENVAATSFVNYVYRIVKLDKDYNQMWEKEYGELSMYSGIGSVIEANNGDLVVTVVDNQKAGLFRMTADGDSLWKYYYHSGDSTMDHGLICEKQTDDMGFVLTGEVYFPQKVWVVKVDSCGCDTAGCICNYSMIFEPEPGKIQAIVYPNPASDYIYVNSEHIIGMNIYTLTGEKLMGSEGVPFINISILESGVYIVRIITKSGAINKKIIKQ